MSEQQMVDLACAIDLILTTSMRDGTLVNGPSAVHFRIRAGGADAVWLDGQLVGNRSSAARQYARLVWRSFQNVHQQARDVAQQADDDGLASTPTPMVIAPPAACWSGWGRVLLWIGLAAGCWFGARLLAGWIVSY